MVLRFHGSHVSPGAVRAATGAGRDGATAAAICNAARSFGLRARGLQLGPEDVGLLERGSILHWQGRHFVVLDRAGPSGVRILDPAGGGRRVPLDEFRQAFTGVALEFEPTSDFRAVPRPPWPIWRYTREILAERSMLARVIASTLMLQVLALALPVLTGMLVDRVVPSQDHRLLGVLTLGTAGLAGGTFLFSFVRARLLLRLRLLLERRLTVGFVQHLIDLPHGFFLERPAGDLMMRLSSNSIVREILTSGALSALLDGALVTTYLAALLAASPLFGLAVALLGSLRIGLFFAVRRRQKDLMAIKLEKEARTRGHEAQMLAGMETLKASGMEQRSAEQWESLFLEALDASFAHGRLGAWQDAAWAVLTVCSPVAVLLLGSAQVLRGDFSLGQMLALSALAAGFLGPLSVLAGTSLQVQAASTYMERIVEILDTPAEQPDAGKLRAARLRGAIEVERVGFRYSRDEPAVLADVSVRVAAGSFLAVVGPSGSGKSTLGRLLLGLYSPTSGRILLDGLVLETLNLRSVRSQVGVVTQRAALFGDTIRQNLTLGAPGVGIDEIELACRLAEIHDEIARLPFGYDTRLTDGGCSFSGGQRQRLALARALIRRPALLLLDEATSDLDPLTEARVQDNLARLTCTRIVIAHRMATIGRADQIIVLDGGRLVETGQHDDLLGANGLYAGLVLAQSDTRNQGTFRAPGGKD